MEIPERPSGGLGSEASPSLDRADDGAAAAAIAAATAAAAADGLMLQQGGDSGGPDGASDSDAVGSRSPQFLSVEMLSNKGERQQQYHQAKQQGPAAVSEAAGDTHQRAQEDSSLPFRQVINAACTAPSLHRLAEAFPFIDIAPCICSDSSRCKFGGEPGPQQEQQKQVLKMLMQEDDTPTEGHNQTEKEPFSLFASPMKAFPISCCSRHAAPQSGIDSSSNSNSSNSDAAASVPQNEESRRGCDWGSFAASLDKELDAIVDELEKGGILDRMQLSLTASLSAPVFAFLKVKEARALEVASQLPRAGPSTSAPANAELGAPLLPKAAGAAAPSGPLAAETEDAFPSVEAGGIFAALAAVEAHCSEVAKKFTDKLATMRRVHQKWEHDRTRQSRKQSQQQIKPYRPLPAYARGQAPLFPYRNTAPPPASLQQLRDRRSRLQRLAGKKGSWELLEELPHVSASFSDAAWFSLGCCAGLTWRRLLHQSGVKASQQLELLRQLQGDDLVEGCFVIDSIRKDRTLLRRVVAGRQGRRQFMEALCSPQAVVRGWVVRCDKERELMLLRLVGVEVYPSDSRELEDRPDSSCMQQEMAAAPSKVNSNDTAPSDTAAYLRRRLLRAEVDIGSSGFYAALPIAAIPRYEFIGGQASGCCGRFVCVGTALRVCLARSAATSGEGEAPGHKNSGASDIGARLQQPLLNEVTLNAAHAHVEALLNLPEDFHNSASLAALLQEHLGFASALPHDAAHPHPEAADFEEIRSLQMPFNADSIEPLQWWDGGSGLLLSRLPYMLRSSGSFANPVATQRQLQAFSALQLLGMTPLPENKELSAVNNGCKKGSISDRKRGIAYTEIEAWETVLERLSNGSFMSFLNTASPCEAIRSAIARAEKDPAVRGGGVGRLLAQQQGEDWARRRLKAGVACARRRELDQALRLYDSALQLRPDYADALIARGAAYANKLEYEKAAADLDAALALEPTNKNAAKYRAIVAERMESKEPGKALNSGDRDRTPSPDRKCKSPEHARLREMSASRATTIIRTGVPGPLSLTTSRNALSNAAAAANVALEKASASGVGRGTAMLGSNNAIDRLRNQQGPQWQHVALVEQQKRRAALLQKQLEHSKEMERQISERKRREQQRQQQAQQQQPPQSSGVSKDKSHKSNQKKSKSKRKRKHSDSSSEGSSG